VGFLPAAASAKKRRWAGALAVNHADTSARAQFEIKVIGSKLNYTVGGDILPPRRIYIRFTVITGESSNASNLG
jgi:hypothetical protein